MKKLCALLLALLLIGSIALAEQLDFASMTDEELNAIISSAQEELNSRNGGDDTEYWYNENGITVYPAGATKFTDIGHMYQYAVAVENNTDKTISLSTDCVVNGWAVMSTGIQDVAPGQSKKDFISMFASDIGVEGEDDVETFDISIEIYDDEYNSLAEFGPITVNLK